MTFSFGIFGQFITERLLQATGRTTLSMYTQLVGAVTNLILDPILIFGWFGLTAMGITGAAAATVIGQILSAAFGVWLNVKKNPDIQLNLKELVPDFAVIKKIYSVGVPSIVMGSIGSVMTYGLNQILMGFSSTATAVFGVYFKLQSFIFMPVFGLNNGMVPIIAYNFGAKNKNRMLRTMKLAIVYAVSILFVGFLVMQIFPAQLFGMFEASADMLAIGVPALRLISTHFVLAGFCIIAGSIFQALGNGVMSLVVSVARQLVVLLPAAYLLSLTGRLNLIWLAFPIAEFMSLALSALFLYKIYQKVIKPL
jgi:putative MATE family efflux protein